EERVYVECEDGGWSRTIIPDVRVVERPRAKDWGATPNEGGVAVAEPLIFHRPHNEVSQGFIEIRDGDSGNRVITVIEVLSLANKAGGHGTELYRKKQDELYDGKISLVEIDLLRGGQSVLAMPYSMLPKSKLVRYLACVTRGWDWDVVAVYQA